MKKGGSLSAYELRLSFTALLDWSNHLSALLLSPELPLPLRGRRLDGELSPLLVFSLCAEVRPLQGTAY